MNITIAVILGTLFVSCGLLCIFLRNQIKSVIFLALLSAILTVIMFYFNAPIAGVFELSVCAGLITVVFISTISLTKVRTQEEIKEHKRYRFRRFIFLPIILIIAGFALYYVFSHRKFNWDVNTVIFSLSLQEVLWNVRQADILGQIIIIFAGVFGILVLFKEQK